MNSEAKIYVAGHNGMVGSAVVRTLYSNGYTNIITRSSRDLDLRIQTDVEDHFSETQPEYVFLCAAKVGGIAANTKYPAEFIMDNLQIQCNVIHSAHKFRVRKLLFLGSSCIYPKYAEQPIREESLLTGALEATNEPYAIAKIAGLKLCSAYRWQYGDDFISAMPTNMYGPNDNYDLDSSHVLPALIRKIHLAKLLAEGRMEEIVSDIALHSGRDAKGDIEKWCNAYGIYRDRVELWGTGMPRRELLHVDDCATALVLMMQVYSAELHLNIGSGVDVSIKELADIVRDAIGYQGLIIFNGKVSDGTPRKLLDVSRLRSLGWEQSVGLKNGIDGVYCMYTNSAHQPAS